jgi:putative metallohydrolase (TIGR04338 family)
MHKHDAKCQQYELYASEGGVQHGREFETLDELQAWVDALRDEIWWERFYPQVLRVEVALAPRGGSVGAWFPREKAGQIEMGPHHRNELVVLHELAHVLADARYKSQAHCPWFARVYLELVYFVMGADAFNALHDAFHEHGIEHDPPRGDFEWGRHREVGAVS